MATPVFNPDPRVMKVIPKGNTSFCFYICLVDILDVAGYTPVFTQANPTPSPANAANQLNWSVDCSFAIPTAEQTFTTWAVPIFHDETYKSNVFTKVEMSYTGGVKKTGTINSQKSKSLDASPVGGDAAVAEPNNEVRPFIIKSSSKDTNYFVVFVVNTGANDTKNYVPPQNVTTAANDPKHIEFTGDTGSGKNNQVAAIGIVPSTLNQYDKISEKTFPHTTINYIAPLPESL